MLSAGTFSCLLHTFFSKYTMHIIYYNKKAKRKNKNKIVEQNIKFEI